jgi:hypothetical protein
MELQHILTANDQYTVYHKNAAATTAQPKKIVPSKKRPVAVDFSGGKLTSDAGALLLKLADQKLQLTQSINSCVHDPRDPRYIHHKQQDLIAQRIYSIALGYEDVNDHTELRKDPALLVAVKNSTDEDCPLGSASTLTRLENRITNKELTDLTKLFVELFIESFKEPPKEIILDFDATDDTIHGNQEGRYFNGFYDSYCFLPLYVFCGDQLLWSQLRTCKKGGHLVLVLSFIILCKGSNKPSLKSRSYFAEMLVFTVPNCLATVIGMATNTFLEFRRMLF